MPIAPYPHTCAICGVEFLASSSRFKYCSESCGREGDNRRRRKGVLVRGEAHGHAKLTERQVRLMREAYVPRVVTTRDLAEQFGVSQRTVWRVLHGENWAHVE